MSKFTPGDWQVRLAPDKSTATVLVSDGNLCSHVCELNAHWICDEHGGNVEANANLLAAAPSMLDALDCCRRQLEITQQMLNQVGNMAWRDVADACRKQADVAKRAMDKAQGGQS